MLTVSKQKAFMNYDYYNREERAICAHLFRLLHDIIPPVSSGDHFYSFLKKSGYQGSLHDPNKVGIYCEVALIRDAYYARKPNIEQFMDRLVQEIAFLQKSNDYRTFSELPEILRNPSRTHPKQIRRKASREGIQLSSDEKSVYGFVEAVFNAKPDLVITFDNSIIAYEAKYTQQFDSTQIERTKNIAKIWSNLLYKDLGFDTCPNQLVSTIGPECFGAQISWEWIFDLSKKIYQVDDRTYRAFRNAVDFIANDIAC